MKIILSRYPLNSMKNIHESHDNEFRPLVEATNHDTGEIIGPVDTDVAEAWVGGQDIVEVIGIYDNHDEAKDAADNFQVEQRSRLVGNRYDRLGCSFNAHEVMSAKEHNEYDASIPSSSEIEEKLRSMLPDDVGVKVVESDFEEECEVHNFLNNDDDEPTLN